jgi:hypothetical protein
MQGCDVIGVDVNDIALERARRHWSSAKQQHPQPIVGSVSFLHCDLLSPNTWDEALLTPFDIVIDTAAFHCFDKACTYMAYRATLNVANPLIVIQELWPKYMDAWVRATKPGSRVLFLNFAYVGCNLYEAMQDSETLMNTPPDTLRNTQE